MTRDEVPRSVERDELSAQECRDLLATQEVGRVGLCSAQGPMVLPVSYVLDGDSVVFRTAPYGVLGRYAWHGLVAFEVDHADPATRTGWSVVVRGEGDLVEGEEELALIRAFHNPQPWAPGSRLLYVRLAWDEITGRRVGRP